MKPPEEWVVMGDLTHFPDLKTSFAVREKMVYGCCIGEWAIRFDVPPPKFIKQIKMGNEIVLISQEPLYTCRFCATSGHNIFQCTQKGIRTLDENEAYGSIGDDEGPLEFGDVEMGECRETGKHDEQILKIAREYYDSLYSKRETHEQCQNQLLANIPRGNFTKTTGPVTREEVLEVIHHWKKGSVPGIGGIPYDFFKEYESIRPPGFDLTEGIRAVMSILIQPTIYNVPIPEKWSIGIIKLLYKKGDKTDIKNYRPLSMTESIYG
jgi:hypothetical protein